VAVLLYEELFERNYGVFSPEEQERIRNARIVIIGCGGIGGAVAVILARTGIGHFVLYEYDTYCPTNMNRQIACFSDTMGVNKAAAIRDMILRINPCAEIIAHQEALKPEEIGAVLQQGDVILPASDEWPLSIALLGAAKEQGVPAIMAYPVGALARVSTFLPDSPYAAECLVMPYKTPYDGLMAFMNNPDHRRTLQYYCSDGNWTQEWFADWCENKKPHAQLCTTVWITSALAAQEIIKLVSKKWKPVTAPHYWHITPTGARIARFGLARRLLSRQVRRPGGQRILPFLHRRPWLLRLFTRLIS